MCFHHVIFHFSKWCAVRGALSFLDVVDGLLKIICRIYVRSDTIFSSSVSDMLPG